MWEKRWWRHGVVGVRMSAAMSASGSTPQVYVLGRVRGYGASRQKRRGARPGPRIVVSSCWLSIVMCIGMSARPDVEDGKCIHGYNDEVL